MSQINVAYNTLKKYLDIYTIATTEFIFPYPNVEFRAEDIVKVTTDNGIYIGEIISITKIDSRYKFVIKIDAENNIVVFRDNLNASEDINFYLYRCRWEV